LLSVIYARVYFPGYSNSLKEIANYLGFQWRDPEASGLYSLTWRYQWEQAPNQQFRQALLTYNADDCEALSMITKALCNHTERVLNQKSDEISIANFVHTDSLKTNPAARLGNFKSSIEGLTKINDAARWDYQRSRIYVRTNIRANSASRNKRLKPHSALEKAVVWKPAVECPECGKNGRTKNLLITRTVHELIYGRSSLRRNVVKYVFQTYRCRSCGCKYGLDKRFGHASRKYGWGVLSYFIYSIISLYASQNSVLKLLNKLLGFDLQRSNLGYMKTRAAEYYKETRDQILHRIIGGGLIHVDETKANIKGRRAYVWVLTNMQEVVYILSENREGEMIQNLLGSYKGVLVSDYYAAYDSIDCPQQKCLIHLMRDLNDDVFKNPFDIELVDIAQKFSSLLTPIIETVDRRGLRKVFLNRHLADVDRFYKNLDSMVLESNIAGKYRQRFTKNREKLFTFLRYDGIPWNNNNAEHAIKSFALLRNVISGPSTKKGTEEYLTLLSVCRTCEYQGIDFLDFLRSGEKDIPTFAKTHFRKKTIQDYC
jgi:Transposase IS66 family/RNase_H superfamily